MATQRLTWREALKWLAWGGGLLLVAALVGLVALMVLFTYEPSPPQRPFDPQLWKANGLDKSHDIAHTVREEMVDSLLAHARLRGKSRAEIVALLGPPEMAYQTGHGQGSPVTRALTTAREYDYYVGISAMDNVYLAVFFDARGRVSDWEQWSD